MFAFLRSFNDMQTAAATRYKDSLFFLYVYRKIRVSTEPEILFNLFLVFIHLNFFLDLFLFFNLFNFSNVCEKNKKERHLIEKKKGKYFRDTWVSYESEQFFARRVVRDFFIFCLLCYFYLNEFGSWEIFWGRFGMRSMLLLDCFSE